MTPCNLPWSVVCPAVLEIQPMQPFLCLLNFLDQAIGHLQPFIAIGSGNGSLTTLHRYWIRQRSLPTLHRYWIRQSVTYNPSSLLDQAIGHLQPFIAIGSGNRSLITHHRYWIRQSVTYACNPSSLLDQTIGHLQPFIAIGSGNRSLTTLHRYWIRQSVTYACNPSSLLENTGCLILVQFPRSSG